LFKVKLRKHKKLIELIANNLKCSYIWQWNFLNQNGQFFALENKDYYDVRYISTCLNY